MLSRSTSFYPIHTFVVLSTLYTLFYPIYTLKQAFKPFKLSLTQFDSFFPDFTSMHHKKKGLVPLLNLYV